MELPIGVALLIAFVGLRLYAARLVLRGHGWAVWIVFAPMLLFGLMALTDAAGRLIAGDLFGAFAIGSVGTGLSVGLLVALVRMTRGINLAESPDQRMSAMVEPAVSFHVAMLGLLLIASLVAVVVLIVYGIGLAAR
jgi:hypothetical protein